MRNIFKRYETYLFLTIIVLSVFIGITNKIFFTPENFFDLLKSYSGVGILSCGILIVMISGGLDISFMAVATIASWIMVKIVINFGGNIFFAFIIVSFVGIILGLINGLIIHFYKVPTIIVTIATMNIFYGLIMVISKAKWIMKLPDWLLEFSKIMVLKLKTQEGSNIGISIHAVAWVIFILITFFILNYTILGRGIYAMGGSLENASRTGFNILFNQLFIYAYMGFCAGCYGILEYTKAGVLAPNSLVGTEFPVILVVILGGASLLGGSGTLLGTNLGIALVAILKNGLTLTRISAYWHDVIIGIMVIISISLTAYQKNLEVKRQESLRIDVE